MLLTNPMTRSETRSQPGARASRLRPECFGVDALPGHIKPRYRRLALIACQDHLERLEPDDGETLIVSCNWLLWQKALAEKKHCVYYELGLLDWSEPDSLITDLYIRANDWVYDGDKDLTLFRGASLGKLFGAEVSLCMVNYLRLERTLAMLIERFQPEDILFFDFVIEANVLTGSLRKKVVASVAADYGVRFVEQRDAEVPAEQQISEDSTAPTGHGPFVRALLAVYGIAIGVATNMRCLFRDKQQRVLMVVISSLAEPLIQNFSYEGRTPIFLARTLPKKIGLLWQCLRQGILLVTPKTVSLSTADQNRIEKIRADLETVFSDPDHRVSDIVRAYVKQNILDAGRLTGVAETVLGAENLLETYQPRRIVVDGERNPPPRIYVDLAQDRGIAVDDTWHSPLAPKNHKVDALGGDERIRPLITRNLTWGSIHESWLDAVGAKQPRIRVGSPLADMYPGNEPPSPGAGKNALLLQYTPNLRDMKGLGASMFENFVTAYRLLKEKGFENVHLKIHPGPGRISPVFFKQISEYFGLNCPILRREPFGECVAWADIVVGPAQTGAMFETLAAGKPYYALMLPPYSMDPAYYGDYPIHASVEELSKALEQPWQPERGNTLLDKLYSTDEYPSGSKRFWQVMNEDT